MATSGETRQASPHARPRPRARRASTVVSVHIEIAERGDGRAVSGVDLGADEHPRRPEGKSSSAQVDAHLEARQDGSRRAARPRRERRGGARGPYLSHLPQLAVGASVHEERRAHQQVRQTERTDGASVTHADVNTRDTLAPARNSPVPVDVAGGHRVSEVGGHLEGDSERKERERRVWGPRMQGRQKRTQKEAAATRLSGMAEISEARRAPAERQSASASDAMAARSSREANGGKRAWTAGWRRAYLTAREVDHGLHVVAVQDVDLKRGNAGQHVRAHSRAGAERSGACHSRNPAPCRPSARPPRNLQRHGHSSNQMRSPARTKRPKQRASRASGLPYLLCRHR